jgi:hypothetical protein
MTQGGDGVPATTGFFPPDDRRSGWGRRVDEATLSVVAHGLLRSVTVVQGGVETLCLRWRALDDGAREAIMHAVMDHADLIGASLQDLVRGITCGEIPSSDEVALWDEPMATLDLTAAPPRSENSRRTRPNWVPTYAHCPRCRYRGVYVVTGRPLIRCRYCRAIADLADDECDAAAAHPERFLARLSPPNAAAGRARL